VSSVRKAVKKRVTCKSAAVKRTLYACCNYSENVIITVFESVARIRLVKNEKTSRVLVICSVWRSEMEL
jgi:hypothetical protein